MGRHAQHRPSRPAESRPERSAPPGELAGPRSDDVVLPIAGVRPPPRRPVPAPHGRSREDGHVVRSSSPLDEGARHRRPVSDLPGAGVLPAAAPGARRDATGPEAPGRRTRGRTDRAGQQARRREGRLPGVLVYATGVVVVLSAVAGVAGSANGGDATGATTTTAATAATKDAAASLHSFFGRGVFHIHHHHHHHAPATEVPEPSPAPPPPVAEAEAEPAPVEEEESPSPEEADAREEADDQEAVAESTTAATPAAPARGASGSSVPSGTWLSGASGEGITDGSFASWRGTPLTIAGTWSDNNEAMTELWQLEPGAEFGSWDQALDIAIGAIGDGESWGAAADGAYDERWRKSLTNLRDLRADRAGTTYIRFAHEMNGNWYAWSVDAGDREDFITSWRRFRAMQQEIFPAAQLVFAVNRESVGSGFDWRESFPGKEHVDVMGVDYYNQYPYVGTAADWARTVQATDKYGAPKGLQRHLDFARSVGLPLAIPEWSGNASNGDSPAFIQGMHQFFSSNAGGGAGQVVYDIQFNVDKNERRWLLYGDTRMPKSAEAYRAAF